MLRSYSLVQHEFSVSVNRPNSLWEWQKRAGSCQMMWVMRIEILYSIPVDPPLVFYLSRVNERAAQRRSVAKFNNQVLKSGTTPTSREAAEARELGVISCDRDIPFLEFSILFSSAYVTHTGARIQVYIHTYIHRGTVFHVFHLWPTHLLVLFPLLAFSPLFTLLRRYVSKWYRFTMYSRICIALINLSKFQSANATNYM
jgi:hypothetical protein